MGDPRRFEAFARFIRTTFPTATTVADVAGGHGELAFWLAELGLRPTIVDPRLATFPRWIHRTLRKRTVRGDQARQGGPSGQPATVERLLARVEDVELRRFDLVAALHPDAATEPAIRAAVAHGIDFAVVPCCVFPLDGIKRSREAWLTHLASLAPGAQLTTLPIEGANTVLWSRTRPTNAQSADDGSIRAPPPCPTPSHLPHRAAVARKLLIRGEQRHPFRERLRHQHPVERVLVHCGQRVNPHRVQTGDR